MRKTALITAVVIALPITVASAQTTTAAPATTMTAPQAAEPPASASEATAVQTAPDTSAPPSKTAIADKIAGDFPKYDAGKKGTLTKGEFNKWMSDLRATAGQPAPDAKWLAGAFAQTDTNSDKKVSSAELTTFLTAGA